MTQFKSVVTLNIFGMGYVKGFKFSALVVHVKY